jgi:DNA-binding LacI/PurR family transcriptional regulator
MSPRSKPTSITEVALKAGVSIQTVSNVLNSPERVKPKTREKIEKVIATLDYTPNLAARRLRSAKSSSLAVRVDSNAPLGGEARGLYSGFIQDEFVYQLTEAAENRGIKVIAYTATSQEDEFTRLRQLLRSKDVDGVVLTSTTENDVRLKMLQELRTPFISFGRPWGAESLYSTAHPWVDVDGAFGTSLATRMFWERGYRKIAFVGWSFSKHESDEPQSVPEDRFNGWKSTLMSLDKKITAAKARTMYSLGKESVASGRKSIASILAKDPDIEAVVCASDTLALGVHLEASRFGKTSIQISGFDNSPVSQEFGISSLDQNLKSVAKSALEVLMGADGNQIRNLDFANDSTLAHVLMRPVLVAR